MHFGVLIAPVFRDLPAAPVTDQHVGVMRDDEALPVHVTRDVPAASAPAIELSVTEDPMTGWNIELVTQNFDFTPQGVGGPSAPNTGHAHLYLNQQKIARLYGPYFHIPDLPPGQHEITVTLSSNDHAHYAVDGAQIAASTVITQHE